MKKVKRGAPGWPFMAFILAAMSALPAGAQQSLSIDEAVGLALENNLGLRSARIGTAIKKRKVDTYLNMFIPTVDLAGTINRLNLEPEAMSIMGTEISPASPQRGLSGSLSANLTLNFALFEGIRNLKLDYESGLIGYAKAQAQLERDVRKSYYQILLLKESISLMEENLAAARRRTDMATANFKAGLVPELTVLQAQVAMENLKPGIADLRNALESAYASFAMILGLPQRAALTLQDTEAPRYVALDLQKFLTQAAADKPDLQELRQSIQVMESTRALTFYQTYTPSLILGWNADPTFKGDPFEDSLFMEDGWAQRSGMFRATLSFRLNGLLPITKEALALTEMDDTVAQMNISLAQAVRGTEVEVYATLLQLEKSRTSMDALLLNVDLAERVYGLTEDSYRAGLKDLLEVQNAELELRKARNEVLKERFNYMNGLLDLEYNIGVPYGTLSRS